MVATNVVLPDYTDEQVDALCKERDYLLIVDKSGSMDIYKDCPGGASRWSFVKEVVGGIIKEMDKFDDTERGGIDLLMFGDSDPATNWYANVTKANYLDYFKGGATDGGTYLGAALDFVFKNHFETRTRPLTIVVMTDGEAHDPELVESSIREAARASGDGKSLAILLLQIGKDPDVMEFFGKLDNRLKDETTPDIVDARSMDELVANYGNLSRLLAAAIED